MQEKDTILSNCYQVIIKCGKDRMAIRCSANQTVLGLKIKIVENTEQDINSIVLLGSGKELKDEQKLSYYDPNEITEFTMLILPPEPGNSMKM